MSLFFYYGEFGKGKILIIWRLEWKVKNIGYGYLEYKD